MRKPEVRFSWEEDKCAGVGSFICICGDDLVKSYSHSVSSGDTEHCPKCGRTYYYKWVGMIVENERSN